MTNMIGCSFAGIPTAVFRIVNNVPGTVSPIPGILVLFAFTPPLQVIRVLTFTVLGECAAGFVGGILFKHRVNLPDLHLESVLDPELNAK